MRSTAVKPQGVEEDNVSLKWEVRYLIKKENNVSDDVTHSYYYGIPKKVKRGTGTREESFLLFLLFWQHVPATNSRAPLYILTKTSIQKNI